MAARPTLPRADFIVVEGSSIRGLREQSGAGGIAAFTHSSGGPNGECGICPIIAGKGTHQVPAMGPQLAVLNHRTSEAKMNSLGSKLATGSVSVALLAAIFFALPVKVDVERPAGYGAAFASDRHDAGDAYNNNTDNVGHEQNQDEQYNGR